LKSPVVLRIFHNGKLEAVKQFAQSQIVIGRNADSQLVLSDESVSPLHTLIEERADGYYISDLGSEAGTVRNGQKLLDEKISSGDEIHVGSYKIQFSVGIPGVPSTAAPAPAPAPKPVASAAPAAPEAKPVKPAAKKEDPETPPPTPVLAPPPAPAKKPAPVAAPTPGSHAIPKSASTKITVRPAGKGTFAPPSQIKNLNESLKPGKGTTVEVLVAWQERVIASHHFNESGVYSMGSDEKNSIVIPALGAGSSFPLLKIQGAVFVRVPQEVSGEIITDRGSITFAELLRQNRLRSVQGMYEVDLQQGEMVRVDFAGATMSVYIRYKAATPKPVVAPLLDLTASEVTGVILAMVVAAIFGLYMALYSPSALDDDENKLEEQIRKATVTFNPPKKVVQVVDNPEPVKQVVKAEAKKTEAPAAVTTKPDPGKAGEVAPKETTDKKKTLTSAKPGGAIKTAPKEGANMKSQKPDPSKVGLLGVFGTKGTQSKLDKAFSGSGELQGMANQANGLSGSNEDRAGDSMGTKLKDTGAGGKGSSTIGISGVGTQGKGSGSYGYGSGGMGKKGNVNINVDAAQGFSGGGIDKEAIRKVILANYRTIQNCYNMALNRSPDLYGKLVIRWQIGEKGRVLSASVKEDNLGNPEVGKCLVERLKTWTFPDPPSDVVADVVYPFVFSAQ